MFTVPLREIASPVPLPTPLIVIALPEADDEILTVEARLTSCTPNITPNRSPAALDACPSNSIAPPLAATVTPP